MFIKLTKSVEKKLISQHIQGGWIDFYDFWSTVPKESLEGYCAACTVYWLRKCLKGKQLESKYFTNIGATKLNIKVHTSAHSLIHTQAIASKNATILRSSVNEFYKKIENNLALAKASLANEYLSLTNAPPFEAMTRMAKVIEDSSKAIEYASSRETNSRVLQGYRELQKDQLKVYEQLKKEANFSQLKLTAEKIKDLTATAERVARDKEKATAFPFVGAVVGLHADLSLDGSLLMPTENVKDSGNTILGGLNSGEGCYISMSWNATKPNEKASGHAVGVYLNHSFKGRTHVYIFDPNVGVFKCKKESFHTFLHEFLSCYQPNCNSLKAVKIKYTKINS